MPLRADDLIGTVTIGNSAVDITSAVKSITMRFGMSLPTSDVKIQFANTPSRWSAWDPLIVSCGLHSRASDTSGNVERFSGYALDPSVTNWPYTPNLVGKGPLYLADQTKVTVLPYATAIETPGSIPAIWYDYSSGDGYVDGIDLTLGDAAGKTDASMVTFILQQCGLGTWILSLSDIQGLPNLLGTYNTEQFVWKAGQSGLSAVQMIDAMFTFRTYESLGGFIKRSQAGFTAPFAYTSAQLIGGTDILKGSTITRDTSHIFNRVVVQGYDDGSGPVAWVASQGVSVLPPNATIITYPFQSSLIENIAISDPTPGISCQAVAERLLQDFSAPRLQARIITWRDDPFYPGQVIYVNDPYLLGVNQSMWLKELEIHVTPNSFRQILTLEAFDYNSTGASPGTPVAVGVWSATAGQGLDLALG